MEGEKERRGRWRKGVEWEGKGASYRRNINSSDRALKARR